MPRDLSRWLGSTSDDTADDGSNDDDHSGPDAGAPTATPGDEECVTVSSAVDLLPVHLAFAFDVSGSMGKGDFSADGSSRRAARALRHRTRERRLSTGCDDDSDIATVVREAEAARDDQISTYVIGVANPPLPGAPDTVSALQDIAEAGGTDQAFLIDTGDPGATTAAFGAAVDAIRDASISCEIIIPAPPEGKTFDKQRIAIRYQGSAGATTFHYDASCASEHSWHYDDPETPCAIVLCPATCTEVRADPQAELEVRFSCEPVVLL